MTPKEAIERMDVGIHRLDAIVSEAIESGATASLEALRSMTPVGETGHLRDSWYADGTSIGNSADYASYVIDESAIADSIRVDLIANGITSGIAAALE